ncbi:MAG TPA: adenine phosphoribosyltransferase [Candidatus Competibacteraceae bacterium]|nr:adenine phosphoribosyltransferase [Candidatus Competibacteraceae bacterium]
MIVYTLDQALALIRDIPDFPKPGVVFKDITPMLADGRAFHAVVEAMAERCRNADLQPDVVACPEARGFIFGAALAYRLGVGFVPIRKPNKLPHATTRISYDLEYGQDTLEVHADAIRAGQRVLLVDDVLATGGTMAACARLVEQLGARPVGCVFLLELGFLHGREKLGGCPVQALQHVG